MTFDDLASGEEVFIDANTFIYHFSPHPTFGPPCTRLVERIEQRDLKGHTSTHVVNEVGYRLLTFEAASVFGWQSKIREKLRKNLGYAKQLSRFRTAVEEILQSNTNVVPIDKGVLVPAAVVTQQTGLLTNDALIVAVMRVHNLANLASADADFDNVPGLTRYAPG